MSIQAFEIQLYEKLNQFFFEHDYLLMVDKKQYRKITTSGFLNVIFTCTSYENEILLDVNMGCRNEKIEQIAQQYLGNARDYWEDANTFVISIGKFNDSKNFRYKIQTDSDLDDACEEIRSFLLVHGFEFLQSNHTLDAIHQMFNATPKLPCKYVYNQSHRRFKGLIVSKFVNDENFKDLFEKHRRGLIFSHASEEEVQTFDRLMGFLMYVSDN
ncbi:hypothetical protein QM480_05415 [Flectobacillus sp. DC10W]|jgi:hypothetical protein|uniref:DUF4304 domain-containing protein n=1 Tax=Flectobacillus longus TaxID=2984207 RepID=A0ABT6YJJ3_9BACT|nr:hypothetical protein [Flectobacillus longus]MDI9863751.1 hypothetical protein [Flectobacillus longus]